jgi:hypothetical protein
MTIIADHSEIVSVLESLYPGAEWILNGQELRFCSGNDHREPTAEEAEAIINHIT